MLLETLRLVDFRNLASLETAFVPRFNVFYGRNGQGKTNLLEAVSLVLSSRSFRGTPRPDELIRFGFPQALLSARAQAADGVEHDVLLRIDPKGKHLHLDGKAARPRVSSWPRLAVISFTPDELRVVRAAPAERRRLVDHGIATIWPAYPQLLLGYGRTLQSRSRVLRDRPHALADLLEVYDQQLALQGAKIAAARCRYLDALRDDFRQAFATIFGESLNIDLHYASRWLGAIPTQDLPPLQQRLAAALAAARDQDLARSTTTQGPQHDDIVLSLEGRPAAQHASQGQTRALVLALKIAQIHQVHHRFQDYPVLLLDDVSSELDQERSARLFAFLRQIRCQVFLTTTRPELLSLTPEDRQCQVRGGSLQL